MYNLKRRMLVASSVALTLVTSLGLASCSSGPSSGAKQQQIVEQYAEKLSNAEPYPLDQMKDSTERSNLREKLLRMNNPNKLGYVTTMTQQGQIIASYTIKGKVTSTQSQLTNTDYALGNSAGSSSSSGSVVQSMGDDGSYGSNEGGENGIFFFTTDGVMVEWNGLWMYSDAPLNLTSKPLITMDVGSKPSSESGQLK